MVRTCHGLPQRFVGKTSLPAGHGSISSFDEIGNIYAISEEADARFGKAAQKCASRFIDRSNVTQYEIYRFATPQRLVARGLDHVDAFGRNVAIERETCSFLTQLLL